MNRLFSHLSRATRRDTSADAQKNLHSTDTIMLSVLCASMVCAALMLSACGGSDAPKQAVVKTVAPAATPATAASAASTAEATAATDSTPASAVTATASAPAAASQATAAGPASTPVVNIDVYGDDQMAGIAVDQYGMPSIVAPNEPTALQSLLQQQLNDTGITVANHATGGTSSSLYNELRGMDGNGDPFADRIKLSAASIVIESHTINDALGGETVADYRQYLSDWVAAVRAAGKTPVLEESGPVCDGEHPQLAAYVQAMDDAATTYNVPIVKQYEYISSVTGWQSHMTGCTVPDAYLDSIKAQREAAVIAPIAAQIIGG